MAIGPDKTVSPLVMLYERATHVDENPRVVVTLIHSVTTDIGSTALPQLVAARPAQPMGMCFVSIRLLPIKKRTITLFYQLSMHLNLNTPITTIY